VTAPLRPPRLMAVLWCAALLLAAACTDTSHGVNPSTPAVVAPADAQQQVHDLAGDLVAALGNPEVRDAGESPAPCDDANDRYNYYMAGIYQLIVPAEKHREILDSAKDWARGHGFEVASENDFPGGLGKFAALDPRTGFEVALASGKPPAMVLHVISPCYRSATPRF
jgi:hypothetical protein